MTAKEIINKYLNLSIWRLFLVNTLIYVFIIYIEYKFIYTDTYYATYLRPLFHSEQDYIMALKDASQSEIYNYLWCPVHVLIQTLLISLCLFIGFNALNYYIQWKDCAKATLQAIVLFALNNLAVIALKALGVINYNPGTVEDVYFLQSIGHFFIENRYPDLVYEFLEKVNIVEIAFCFLQAYTINHTLHLKFKTVLYMTIAIYLFGTIIYICFTQFLAYLF